MWLNKTHIHGKYLIVFCGLKTIHVIEMQIKMLLIRRFLIFYGLIYLVKGDINIEVFDADVTGFVSFIINVV